MEDISVISGAVTDGNWRLAAVLGIILLTKLVQQFNKYWAPLGSGKVAVPLAALSGIAAAMLPCVVAKQQLGVVAWLTLAVDGALTGLAAAGFYRGVQKINEKPGKDDLLPFPGEPPVLPKASVIGGTSSDLETPVDKPKPSK